MARGLGVPASLVWLAVAACGEPAAQEPATQPVVAQAPAPAAGGPAIEASIHPDLPVHSFRLVGRPMAEDSGTFAATGVEIRRAGEAEPIQVIEDLAVEVPMGGAAGGIEVVDMNFDGYGDLRIVEFLPAGPNVPYLNWLFDPGSERFVPSPTLDEMTSPSFDAAARRIRSQWRDGAASYGTDVYEVIEGRPVLVGKERREYTEPGLYELTVSELRDGEWRVVERRVVRE